MKKIFFTFLTVLLATLAAQAATDYGFEVAGVTVTSANCNNIVTNYITSGTVYYVPSSNTLYMNNVTITMTGDYNRVINNLECSDLKVEFSGTCNLYARDAAVVRIRRTTTLSAPSASTVVNITGVNENGIWLATRNVFDLTIQGPGTFNISSTNNTAIEDEENGSTSHVDIWHNVYFNNVNAVLSSGGNSVVKRLLLNFKAGSSVRFKATNNSSYPVINYCGWQLYGNETLLEPYGAYYSNNSVYDTTGGKVYNKDVYVSDDYLAFINSTNFPDANFSVYLFGLYPKGYITQDDVNNRTTLDLGNRGISNLQGIEYFTNLQTLFLDNNNLTSLSRLSGLSKLKTLYCNNNQLTSLTLSYFPNLEYLNCSYNKLTTLYANNFSGLKTLNCSYNTLLTTLYCDNDDLTTLNVTGCTAMTKLYGYNNPSLSTVTGLADCTAITHLDLDYCAITSLSAVDSMTNIEMILARNNKLTTLTVNNKSKLTHLLVSGNTLLTKLYCYSNALTSLYVEGCTALQDLRCYENASLAAIIGLADCKAITYLDCEDCAITSLSGVNNMTNIATLLARNNKLTSLEVTYKSKLTNLRVNGNTTLTVLHCFNNDLTTLNVTGCTALNTLNCYNNANLASITGLANCTAITRLDCKNCALTSLPGLNNMTQIQRLYASNNQLTSITLTNKASLIQVSLQNNPQMTTADIYNNSTLSSLDISNCTALTTLKSYSNALTTLTVTGNTAMYWMSCYGNQLTTLSVQGCTALNALYCYQNKISGSGMTTLVNSLPTRTASNRGHLYVMYNTDENNSITPAQITTAQNKHWGVWQYYGFAWGEMTATERGDVNGDGQVKIDDVTALINLLLSDNTPPSTADCNIDARVNISDVTALINYLLSGSWY